MTKIPNGFIKDSEGNYRRGDYLFKEGQIVKAFKETEEIKELPKTGTLEECIAAVLSYSEEIGNTNPLVNTVYINKINDNEYEISDKQTDKTEAVITTDRKVHYKHPAVKSTDDEDLKPTTDEAKAPEQKELPTEPQAFEDLKEADDSKWKIEINVNGELTYYNRLTIKDINEILSVANSISPTIQYESEVKESDIYKSFDKLYGVSKMTEDAALSFIDELKNTNRIADSDYNELKRILTEIVKLKEADEKEFPSEEVDEQPSKEDSSTPISMESAYFIRRPKDIEDLQDKISKHLVQLSTYTIVDEITLTPEEFKQYTDNLRQDTEFLKSFRPEQSDADFTCLAVKSEDKTLLIDNSGYDSAQYVSLI